MKKNALFILFSITLIFADAQTVLLNVDRTSEERKTERGPNLKKFTHFYLKLGWVASGDKEGARIKHGSSINFGFGIRKKYKVSSIYSPGWDIEIQSTGYKLRQESGRILPDTIINESSWFNQFGASISFLNRINFDPNRGNFLGTYMDIGIAGDIISMSYSTRNELPDESVLSTTINNLAYTYDFGARGILRFGYSHISLYATYRLTKYFKPSFNYPDLPRVIVGLELAIF